MTKLSSLRFTVLVAGLALLLGPSPQRIATAQGLGPARPVVLKPLKSDRSPALRSLTPRAPTWPQGSAQGPVQQGPARASAEDAYDLPMFPLPGIADFGDDEGAPPAPERPRPAEPLPPRRPPNAAAAPDGLASGAAPDLSLPAPLVSFDGLSNEDNRAVLGFRVAPPDPSGAAGPDHYVQWVNLVFAVYDKAGNRLYGPAAGNTLWSGFGGPCETENDGDVIVLYDKYANRWLLSQFAFSSFNGPFYQCVAVSATSDPTGAYNRYAFLVSDTKLNDYPKFGVWPDGYYMSVNQFRAGSLAFAGAGLFAFERDRMLLGEPANAVYFDLEAIAPPLLGGLLPSDADGVILPPPGSPNSFTHFGAPPTFPTHRLQLFEFRVDWLSPAASTLTGPQVINVAPFNPDLCPALREQCVPQPGTSQRLEAISDRLMWRLQYRNFADYATLVTNHTVNAGGGRAGIRWYELRKRPGLPWALFQQGTYAPAGTAHRWMGSIAMDASGNVALGFTASSETLFPSIRYVGRQRDDPAGTLPRGETVVINGPASQVGSARWGDYSQMALDPDDDCTFWFTHEYVERSDITVAWKTRIAAFRFDGCGRSTTG